MSRMLAASFMVGRSLSDPMIIPTTAPCDMVLDGKGAYCYCYYHHYYYCCYSYCYYCSHCHC